MVPRWEAGGGKGTEVRSAQGTGEQLVFVYFLRETLGQKLADRQGRAGGSGGAVQRKQQRPGLLPAFVVGKWRQVGQIR
jgi:hypothetical protein